MTIFQHKESMLFERVSWVNGVWCFLFGVFYFIYKGVYKHAVLSFIAACFTVGVSWFVYPFFAPHILKTYYVRKGYVITYDDSSFSVTHTAIPREEHSEKNRNST